MSVWIIKHEIQEENETGILNHIWFMSKPFSGKTSYQPNLIYNFLCFQALIKTKIEISLEVNLRTDFTYNVGSEGWFCILDCIHYILYLMALHALCFKSDALSLIKILLLFFSLSKHSRKLKDAFSFL